MYNREYPWSYCANAQMYNFYRCPYCYGPYIPFNDEAEYDSRELVEDIEAVKLQDYGPKPFVININEATKRNKNFRTTLWTGKHLQVTLMSINVRDDIGLEIHPNVDQFIRIEEGQALVEMGRDKNNLNFKKRVRDDFAIMIPAGTWHNVINVGNRPLKVYSIYAPPQHPHNAVHITKADAEAAERD